MKPKNFLLLLFLMMCGLSATAQTADANECAESSYSVKSLLNGTTSPRHFANHFTVTPPKGYVLIDEENCLKELKTDGQQMLGNIVFDSGYTYNDFDESKDHIAEWTIGSLVAGKILTKVRFWAMIAKG